MNDLASQTADYIAQRANELAERAVEAQYAQSPALWQRYGPRGRAKCVEDAVYHLKQLSSAIRGESPPLFSEYVDWARSVMIAYGVEGRDFAEQLACLSTVLCSELPNAAELVNAYLSAALARLAEPGEPPESALGSSSLAMRYLERLLAYDRRSALSLVEQALAEGTSLREVYLEVIQRAQRELGRLWQANRISIAQEHYGTAVSQLLVARLYPRIMHAPSGGPRILVACVSGELHELGARVAADFFEMEGWDTYYLGASTPAAAVVQTLRDLHPDIFAVGVTMGFHVAAAQHLIAAVRSMPELNDIKILVGGRAFHADPQLFRHIGADAVAGDAEDAVRQGRALLSSTPPVR